MFSKVRYTVFGLVFLSSGLQLSGQTAANKPTSVSVVPSASNTAVTPGAYSGTMKVNWIKTRDAVGNTSGVSDYNAFNQVSDINLVKESVQYFDGLGRPLQTVSRQATTGSTASDIVTPMVYDEMGRQLYQYMPYVATTSNGSFKLNPFAEQKTYLQGKYPGESFFYSKSVVEASSLNRVTKTFAPGNSWVGSEVSSSNPSGTEHMIATQYLLNTSDDQVHIWSIGFSPITGNPASDNGINIPTSSGSALYGAGELNKMVTIDEAGNDVVEYKDREGQVVFKKVRIASGTGGNAAYDNYLCTYYIYDDFNRLRFVIPPKATAAVLTNNWQLSAEVIEELCFRYEYDQQGRMIAKKVPGAGWVYMVYDRRDRLVATQDANLRQQGLWMATRYDQLNRPVMTGLLQSNTPGSGQSEFTYLTAQYATDALTLNQSPGSANNTVSLDLYLPTDQMPYTYSGSAGQLSNVVYAARNSITINGEYVSTDVSLEFEATILSGSNTSAFPVEVNGSLPGTIKALTITHYDDYPASAPAYQSGQNSRLTVLSSNNYPEPLNSTSSVHTRGVVTQTQVRVLENLSDIDANPWLESTVYYDNRGRMIQSNATNLKGGRDILSNRYDYVGKLLVSVMEHKNPAAGNIATQVKTNNEYDHMGRLVAVWKTLNDATEKILIAKNEYDDLGQLVRKSLGRKKNSDNTYPVSATPLETLDYEYNVRGWLKSVNKDYALNSGPNASNRWFGMELSYDWGFDKNQFNGNISGSKWRSKGDGEQRAFGYDYDKANRLLYADFNQRAGSNWTKSISSGYTIDFSVLMGNGVDPLTAYDANGNIRSMKQMGLRLSSSAVIDELEYNYYSNSNKLKNVRDLQNDPTTVLGDFRSSQKYVDALGVAGKQATTVDYTYDGNGNLKKDLNKDIGDNNVDGIEYNHLNLPYKITVKSPSGDKGTITYIYDAVGNKLEKRVHDNTLATGSDKYTTYMGPFVYELDKLQFISHEEGRIRPKETVVNGQPATEYVYDYYVKDHLGNVRMLLTEEVQKDVYPVASLENAQSVSLEKMYYNIQPINIVNTTLLSSPPSYSNDANGIPTNNGYITPAAGSERMYRLNGNGTRTGMGITLKVMAGDVVDILAQSYWVNNEGSLGQPAGNTELLNLLEEMVGSGLPGGRKGVSASQLNSIADITSKLTSFLGDQSQQTNRPKAYVNWILFDENFRPVIGSGNTNSGFDAVGDNGGRKAHTRSTGAITKNGYLYVYCSNESKLDVFFDNLQVVHTRGALLEETHYYPFGLTMAGISSKVSGGVENKKKYNGIELEGDFELNVYDAQLRELDPQVGRWWEIDPKIESMEMWSTYASNYDNPIRYSDPLGDEGKDCCKWLVDAGKWVLSKTDAIGNSKPVRWINENLNPLTSAAEVITGKSNESDYTQEKPRLQSAAELGMALIPGGKTESTLLKSAEKSLFNQEVKQAQKTISLDNNALIAAVEKGEKKIVKAAIGSDKPIVSITAAKEFLQKGNKQDLKNFMTEIGATISKKGGSASQAAGLQQSATNLGRSLGKKDAMILAGAINNNATILTRDKQFSTLISSLGFSVKGF